MSRSIHATNGAATVVANTPSKRLKRASLFEIRAYKSSILSYALMRRAHHMHMRVSRRRTHYTQTLALHAGTYHVSAHYAWLRTFRVQTWT